MIRRPSFPVYRVSERPARRSFENWLTLVTFVLAILVAAGLLARAAGPIPDTSFAPAAHLVGP